MNDAEDGRGRSDAQGQGHDGHRAEARPLPERPKAFLGPAQTRRRPRPGTPAHRIQPPFWSMPEISRVSSHRVILVGAMSAPQYFQKGFNLKKVVGPVLAQNYASEVVERLKDLGYVARAGEMTLKLAREFGFCYGVDRAVEYAYETREQFPDRRIFLSGEIIHNPDVNGRIGRMGIRLLPEDEGPRGRATRRSRQATWSSCRPSASR